MYLPGILQHRDFRVAESIDRLLAVADDEDRRIRDESEPFTPGFDQQRDQLPLRAARVLELVDQDVVISRFETEAALGEFIHPAQQLQRPLEDVGEIQHRARRQVSGDTARARRQTSGGCHARGRR